MTVRKSSTVALRPPSNVASRLWNSGSERVMLSRTMETRMYFPSWARNRNPRSFTDHVSMIGLVQGSGR